MTGSRGKDYKCTIEWLLFYKERMKLSQLSILVFLLWACTSPADNPNSGLVTATSSPAVIQGGTSAPYPSPVVQESERWIEVDLQAQKVRLYQGNSASGEYTAGTGVNQSPQTTTYRGLFKITSKYKGPIETVPGVFVKDVLEFDPEHGNGIHSMPMDKDGNLLDDRLGQPVTAGCVRVGEADRVYDFAYVGMKVWIH
jgi:lipoprotein-anchoring transpeptidase ErfK/SrfK